MVQDQPNAISILTPRIRSAQRIQSTLFSATTAPLWPLTLYIHSSVCPCLSLFAR